MNSQDKKQIFLNAIKDSPDLSVDIKERFQEQVLKMGEEELEVFFKTIKEAESENDLDKKISQIKDEEKKGHADFLETARDFLKNDVQKKLKKQEDFDKNKAEKLLNEIKSL